MIRSGMLKFTKQKALFLAMVVFAWFHFSSAQGTHNIFQDQDGDGLTDQEEATYGTDLHNSDTDHDGYSDGTEVESGYDPLKTAPGDKIIPTEATVNEKSAQVQTTMVAGQKISNTNTTEEVLSVESATSASGAGNLTDAMLQKMQEMKSEELSVLKELNQNPEAFEDETKLEQLENISFTQEELSSIISGSLNTEGAAKKLEIIQESEISVIKTPAGENEEEVKQKIKKQIEEYVVASGYIMLQNAPFDVNNIDELHTQSQSLMTELAVLMQQGDVSKITDLQARSKKMYEGLKAVPVPEELKKAHLIGLSIIKYLSDQDVSTLADQSDPLKQVVMIGSLQGVMSQLQETEAEVSAVFEKYGIKSFGPSTTTDVITGSATDTGKQDSD